MALDDPYFRDRGGDFESVAERLLRSLLGLPELRAGIDASRGAIAVGVDNGPLDLFHLQRAGIAAMVSESGGATSHASIIARAFGLPYVVGVRKPLGETATLKFNPRMLSANFSASRSEAAR